MALSLCTVFGVAGCGSDGGSVSPLKESDVEFWGTYATEKVLQDKHDYDSVKRDAAINLTVAKGEYESSQIIMTAANDVPSYTVTVTDLKTSDNKVFPKENISIYNEKYIEVVSVYKAYEGAVPGFYPDALLPMDTAVKWGENKISKGNNQGIYVTFDNNAHKDENGEYIMTDGDYTYFDSGVYTGNMTIKYGDFSKAIPITLEILDATVGEENHVQSHFGSYRSKGTADLEDTQAEKDAWNQKFYEYRITGDQVLADFAYDDNMIKNYVAATMKYLKSPKCSGLSLPTRNVYNYQYTSSDGVTSGETVIDKDFFKDFVWAYLNESVAQNYNFVAKINVSCSIIDEPTSHPELARRVPAVMELFRLAREELAAEIYDLVKGNYKNADYKLTDYQKKIYDKLTDEQKAAYEGISEEFMQQLISGVLNIKMPVTSDYAPGYNIETYCPNANLYDSEASRKVFSDHQQSMKETYETLYHNGYTLNGNTYVYDWYEYKTCEWWYTAASVPCITFDFEMPLAGIRTNGWMLADYDADGFLYWAVDLFAYDSTGGSGVYYNIEDYYTENAMRYTKSSGNGYLFYPGGQYELSEPVASMRIEAYRDGLEEYELIYGLKETYSQYGFDASDVISSIGTSIYTGMVSTATGATMAAARTALLQVVNCAASDAKMFITGYNEDGYGNCTYKVFMKEGYELKNRGVTVTDCEKVDGGVMYTVVVKLKDATNSVSLSFEAGGKTYKFELGLGGEAEVNDASIFKSAFKKSTVAPSSKIEDGMIKLTLPESGSKSQRVMLGGEILSKFKTGVKKILFHIENPTDGDVKIVISLKRSDRDVSLELVNQVLKPGANVVEFSVNGDWNSATADNLLITFGDGKEQPERTIYFKDVVVYYK